METLLARMENDRDRLVVIIAGYRADLDRFLDTNQGLRSRFTRTIDFLKKQNVWVIGLVGEAKTAYDKADLTGPLALVVGNEGKGISRLVREHCDLLITLPMRGSVNSLNAAVAGSIALYEALRQRSNKK